MRDFWALLQNHNFSKLWGSQIMSQVAQNLLFFALIIRVFELASHTKFANISVALVVLAFGIPAIFFGLVAGAYVDYWNRKWVMVICNVVRAALVLLYPFVETNLWGVLILSFGIATASQFFIPAEAAAIPKLVKDKQLVAANSLFVFSMYAAFIVGYGSSAATIQLLGPNGPYIATAVLWAGAALLDLWLPTLKSSRQQAVKLASEARAVAKEITANLRTVWNTHSLYFPIVLLATAQAVVGIILALAPALSLAVLKTPLTNASHILIIPAGLGLIVGVGLVGPLTRRWPATRVAAVSFVLGAAGLLLMGLSGLLYRQVNGQMLATEGQVQLVVAALAFTLGLLNAVISTASQTLLQQNSTDETRGKVFSVLNVLINVAATLPVVLAGILADVFSVTKVFAALGIVLLVFGIMQMVALRKMSLKQG